MTTSKRKVRQYDNEFKARAVKLYYSSEKSYTELGKALGIPAATLSTWVYNAKQSHQKGISDKSVVASDDLTKELMPHFCGSI